MSELLFTLPLTKAFPLSACVSFFSSRVLMSVEKTICYHSELQNPACSFCDNQSHGESSWIGHALEALWQRLMEDVSFFFFSFFFLFFAFTLLVVETDWDVCQMTFLKNLFAALIPWVKANQRGLQKMENGKTQIVKRNDGGWLFSVLKRKYIEIYIYQLKKCLIFRW